MDTMSFIVGEVIPTWAIARGARVMRDSKTKLVDRVLIPTGEGTEVVSAYVGDTVVYQGNNALVISKNVADDYKA